MRREDRTGRVGSVGELDRGLVDWIIRESWRADWWTGQ